MIRQLVTHLFEHERIKTTLTRAKLLRRYAERTISMAKRGSEKGRLKVFDIINVLFACRYYNITIYTEAIDWLKGSDGAGRKIQAQAWGVHEGMETGTQPG
jgi:ribosomal protein L17